MKNMLRRTSVLALSLALAWNPARAGFMDDFYTAAGAAVNITPADVRKAGSGNFVTGGSVIWRVPQRSFTPFLWQPPGLKAGCGGIDMYMGSFGFANTSEFVDYLRNVGQNALGIFFKMALKAMSPDLEGAINDITAMINMFNQSVTSSCEVARNLTENYLPSQATMNKAVKDAIGIDRENGVVTDVVAGIRKFATNMGAVQATVDARATNSGGKKVRAVSRNYIWSAMNSGQMADFPTSLKEVAMSIASATIVRVDTTSADAAPIPDARPATLNMRDLVGSWDDTTLTLNIMRCDDSEECLNPTTNAEHQTGFARNVYTRLLALRTKIVNRTPLDASDNASLQLLGMTTMPVWKVLELTSSPGRIWLSDEYIKKFSNVIGYELAIGFVTSITYDIEKMLHKTKSEGDDPAVIENLTLILQRMQKLRDDAAIVKKQIDENGGGVAGAIAEIQHLERTLYQNMSTRLMGNLKYAQR